MEKREPVDLLVKASGLSRRAFAREYGVGEQVLLRLAQGRFSRVPESIAAAVEEHHGAAVRRQLLVDAYGWGDLQDAYREWRNALDPEQLPTEEALAVQDSALSPAQRLAAAVGSMSKLAKVTKSHDFVVRRYVHGETRELPASMRAAMEEQSWPHTDQLDRAQQRWLDRQVTK